MAKTKAQRDLEKANRERRDRDYLFERLGSIDSIADALILVANGPRQGEPARSYYSNLAFFLQNGFAVPGGSSGHERSLYAKFLERLAQAGKIDGAVAEQSIAKLHGSATS